MKEKVRAFRLLFDGYDSAYGTLTNLKEDYETGKINGKCLLVHNKVTDELIEKHLKGDGAGIRINPLKENDKLRYFALDLDKNCNESPLIHSIEEIESIIKKLNLPLIPCYSKSGNVHLYCFAKEDIKATFFVKIMNKWAGLIGYGGCEKFPTQTHRANPEDIGKALNLPYFNHKETVRYAIRNGKKLSLEEFIEFANLSRVTAKELKNFEYSFQDDDFNDAPPCLQTLRSLGLNEGSRKNGLFNVGVYLKKKFPNEYDEKLVDFNVKILQPQLKNFEVQDIIKSLRKDYGYKCKEPPICQFCDKIECVKRKYGIGTNQKTGRITFDNLTKYQSLDSVRWYLEVKGKRIQVSTDELFNQKLLQKRLAESCGFVFRPMKTDLWLDVVHDMMENCTVIDDPEDASKRGQFLGLLDSFFERNALGETKDDFLKMGTFFDEKKGVVYFKSMELFKFLKNMGFYYVEHEVWNWVREQGGENSTLYIGKKQARAWAIKREKQDKKEELL